MPVYGECGGLMYLSETIHSDKTYRMCGILPANAEMTRRIQGRGYVKGDSIGNRSLLKSGQMVTGHEFHYSRLAPSRDARYALRLSRGKEIDNGMDGLVAQDVLGCCTHAYFTPAVAELFVDASSRFSRL